MIFYEVFYKRYGVRLPQHLMTPIVAPIERFSFPKNSVFHFFTFDNVNHGPSSDEYIFRDVKKLILMDHVVELTDNKGSPKKVQSQIAPFIRDYHIKNRRFKYIKDVTAAVRDENTLLVVNYGFALKIYRYLRSIYSEYYKWWNVQRTLWDTIAKACATSERHHYVTIDLPKTLPSVGTLNIYSTVMNQNLVKIFNTSESLFLLELWKWLGKETRTLSVMSNLKKEDFAKINILYQDNGKWIIFNLGILNSWREGGEGDEKEKGFVRLPPEQLQKRFLRLMMSFMQYRSEPEGVDPFTEEEEIKERGEDEDDDTETETVVDPVHDAQAADKPTHANPVGEMPDDDEENNAVADDDKLNKSEHLLTTLDEDLEELKNIESKNIIEETEHAEAKQKVFKNKTINHADFEKETLPIDGVLRECNALAEDGLITAAEYKGLLKQAQICSTIKSPYGGNETLEEHAVVTEELVKITESASIVDMPTVLDKSMLKSSLIDFDEKYVTKVMSKDVSGMVLNMQKSGVIIQNYDVEQVSDIMGDYQMHTLRVKPVQGSASTLRFKLPVVDPDGTYRSNGNTYRLRKQRGDLPIRKIYFDEVALTSYYGKTFINRSTKKTNDYGNWLRNKIMVIGLDDTNTKITNLHPGDVFDNLFKAPRIYSTIAMGFRSFTVGNYHLIFDHKEREKQFNAETIKEFETDGMVLVGYTDKGTYVVVDKTDAFYESRGKNLELLGSAESLFGIENKGCPIDFTEIKIFSKAIPIALILAYQLGLGKLLDLLKVTPRRVLAGQRLNLEDHEYSLVFSDETLIFNKDDKLPTLILAGFNEYSKAIRGFSVYTFDKPNVYLNVIETTGISSKYLREADLMTDMFIDPITKELLIGMGEPTTFRGLLIRASEMLLLDDSPDQLDMRHMRIKGYERMAGAVYSELVQSVRQHKGKSGRNKSPMELNPYAVWKKIATDPSVSMLSEINPIEQLKSTEQITYSGVGGRNSRSMVKSTREYHESDMGIVSESTVDSSDVAINVFSSADPQFNSLRGSTKKYDLKKSGSTALLSTSALMSVGTDRDD